MKDDSNINEKASSDFDKDSDGKFRSGIIKKTENFDLFISYKRDNGGDHGQQIAERLYRELTKKGLKVWLDNEEIGYSRDFEVRIEEAILHSKKFMCIMSPAWLKSENCRYEFLKAVSFEKRIIPVHYREFREDLLQQKHDKILTEDQWRRLDRPQELNFSKEEYFASGFRDLLSVCALKDRITSRHTKILYESYYWNMFGRPDGMLLRGMDLTKAKRLKTSCNGDQESPSFSEIQNEFLEASERFVEAESSRKRKVFISFSKKSSDLAQSVNLELRLQNISTWYENTNSEADKSDFIESILNSETVLHCVSDMEEEDDLVLAFARSNDKRILYLTDSQEILEDRKKKDEKGYFYWDDGLILEDLVTSIKGDAEYLGIHGPLLDGAYMWLKSGKSDSKLLPLKEARVLREWYQAAEAQGSEPKPNTNMVDFVERSIVKGEAMANRKRMFFWTTLVGSIVLISLAIAVFRQNRKLESSKAKTELAETRAKKALREARVAEKNAKLINKRAERQQEKARQDSLDYANRSIQLKSQIEAKEADISEKLAQIAAQDSVLKNMNTDLAAMQSQFTEIQENQHALEKDVANKVQQLKLLTARAEVIKNASLGRAEARSAFHYIRFGFDAIAKEKADSAVTHLLQGNSQVQIQPLYDVYKELIPESHPVSIEAHEKTKPMKTLLSELNYTADDLTPKYSLYGPSNVTIGAIQEKYLGEKRDLFSSHCFNSDSTVIAIGMKDGTVSIFTVRDEKLLESFKYHSHRITSMVFSPSNRFLAVTGIDQRFTIFPFDKNFNRDEEIDIIEQDTESRVKQLFFLGNDILICLDSRGAKAWGINVNEIKKLTVNEK